MLPPMTLIASVKAATVAIRSYFRSARLQINVGQHQLPTSGQIIVVMIDAGTTIPPIPRPARTSSPYNL